MNGQQAQAIEKMADGDNVMEIGFKRLSENAVLPTKANPTDSGLDIFAAEDVIIAPGETKVIPTDLAIELPSGYEAVVRPRSGITSKTKLRVQLGTIDESYRGNIGVIADSIQQYVSGDDYSWAWSLQNVPTQINGRAVDGSIIVKRGDKIAQLVVQQLPQTVAVEITDELAETDRGGNGFGSSGV